MPIYEYQCPECANIFEEWAKASEMKDLAPCPLCQTPSERIISHTAFVLKGGGWYVTDYGYRKNISEGATESAGGAAAVPPTGDSGGASSNSPDNSGSSASQAPASSAAESPSPTAKASAEAKPATQPATAAAAKPSTNSAGA